MKQGSFAMAFTFAPGKLKTQFSAVGIGFAAEGAKEQFGCFELITLEVNKSDEGVTSEVCLFVPGLPLEVVGEQLEGGVIAISRKNLHPQPVEGESEALRGGGLQNAADVGDAFLMFSKPEEMESGLIAAKMWIFMQCKNLPFIGKNALRCHFLNLVGASYVKDAQEEILPYCVRLDTMLTRERQHLACSSVVGTKRCRQENGRKIPK
jgi:hypothetical protein